MTDTEIRRDLLVAFEYCYLHDAWVTPLEEALAGLSAEDALRAVGTHDKCVWEIVLHLATWNENIVERILTGEPARPADGHWPSLPETVDDRAWQTATTRLWNSLNLVRSTLETARFDQISGPPWGIPDLLCRMTHMGYHLGQIVIIRCALDTGSNS